MKAGIVKYIVVIWFSFLLMLGNTPMEFVHLFADHKDTVHNDHKGLVIEKKHHHCAYLSLTLTSFINDYSIPCFFYTPASYTVRYLAPLSYSYSQRVATIALRGPPMV